jgi:hypothetical protein
MSDLLKVWRVILRNHAQGKITPPEDIKDPSGPILKLIDMGIVDCGMDGYWLTDKAMLWYDCLQEMMKQHPLVDVAYHEADHHDRIINSAGGPPKRCPCSLCTAVHFLRNAGGQGGAAHPDPDPDPKEKP